jgi:hypothetical protein
MAISERKVVGDVGSAELDELRLTVNSLLDALDTFTVSVGAASAITTIALAATTLEAGIEANCYKIIQTPKIPRARHIP